MNFKLTIEKAAVVGIDTVAMYLAAQAIKQRKRSRTSNISLLRASTLSHAHVSNPPAGNAPKRKPPTTRTVD